MFEDEDRRSQQFRDPIDTPAHYRLYKISLTIQPDQKNFSIAWDNKWEEIFSKKIVFPLFSLFRSVQEGDSAEGCFIACGW